MEDKYEVKTNKEGTYYYKNTFLHRENGPAIEYFDGSKEWWVNGNIHREDGPALESSNGHKAWYINGKRHREDGPAIESSTGYKSWWVGGKRHREDGPAVLYANGNKEWEINDNNITIEVEEWMLTNNIPDHSLWTNKEIALFKLKFL